MGSHDPPSAYNFANGQPSSPPMTPGARPQPRFSPQTSHKPLNVKRIGIAMFAQSPPFEFIKPIGQGPQFHFTRPQSRDRSSRPSSNSGRGYAASGSSSENGEETDEESTEEAPRPVRRVEHADFVIEELDSGYFGDLEVIQPDHFEEPKSDRGEKILEENGIIDDFKNLRCQIGSSDEEEQQQMYRRKKKRWSAGIYNPKRSYTQSIEGDSSYSDNDPLDDVDPSARRLRRRVRGPGDRSSLIFEDKGFANTNNVVLEESEEGFEVAHSKGPPSIPSDDGFTLDELPFYGYFAVDPMEVEFESS